MAARLSALSLSSSQQTRICQFVCPLVHLPPFVVSVWPGERWPLALNTSQPVGGTHLEMFKLRVLSEVSSGATVAQHPTACGRDSELASRRAGDSGDSQKAGQSRLEAAESAHEWTTPNDRTHFSWIIGDSSDAARPASRTRKLGRLSLRTACCSANQLILLSNWDFKLLQCQFLSSAKCVCVEMPTRLADLSLASISCPLATIMRPSRVDWIALADQTNLANRTPKANESRQSGLGGWRKTKNRKWRAKSGGEQIISICVC